MSRYLERNMQRDEQIVYAAELHWIVYKHGIVMTLVGALFGHFGHPLVLKFIGEQSAKVMEKPLMFLAAGIVFVGALQLIFSFIEQISTELVITNQRVIAKHGLIATTTFELMLAKVEGANIDQTISGRMLGFGTVMVKGTGGGISPIDHVAQPYRFHSFLMEAIKEVHEPQGMHIHSND